MYANKKNGLKKVSCGSEVQKTPLCVEKFQEFVTTLFSVMFAWKQPPIKIIWIKKIPYTKRCEKRRYQHIETDNRTRINATSKLIASQIEGQEDEKT